MSKRQHKPKSENSSKKKWQRRGPADYAALAHTKDLRWLGPAVSNIQTKTEWSCPQEHRWWATYNSIDRITGCPQCRFEKRQKKPAQYHALAKKRGFKWLGPFVRTTYIKTEWQCAQGHRWQANYHNIRYNSGCPFCAGKLPKTEEDYYALAQERNFQWVGRKLPPNTSTKTTWKCSRGHRWPSKYDTINQGKGCPHCAGRAPKATIHDYIKLAKKRGFQWIERELPLNASTKTTWKCSRGHRWQSRYTAIKQGKGCPHCAGKAPKTDSDYHALAKKRRFKWLGPMVKYNNLPTSWECPQGHSWQTTYNAINGGRGCPDCAGNRRKTPADYHALAKKRGFKWLGPEVTNVVTKTQWQCEKDHTWWTRYNNIHQGTGCPYCRYLTVSSKARE